MVQEQNWVERSNARCKKTWCTFNVFLVRRWQHGTNIGRSSARKKPKVWKLNLRRFKVGTASIILSLTSWALNRSYLREHKFLHKLPHVVNRLQLKTFLTFPFSEKVSFGFYQAFPSYDNLIMKSEKVSWLRNACLMVISKRSHIIKIE